MLASYSIFCYKNVPFQSRFLRVHALRVNSCERVKAKSFKITKHVRISKQVCIVTFNRTIMSLYTFNFFLLLEIKFLI